MTTKDRIMNALCGAGAFKYYGTRPMMTASDIQRFINPRVPAARSAPTTVSLGTVSSALNQLVKEGLVLRVKGFGPRGGYGYARPHWDAPVVP